MLEANYLHNHLQRCWFFHIEQESCIKFVLGFLNLSVYVPILSISFEETKSLTNFIPFNMFLNHNYVMNAYQVNESKHFRSENCPYNLAISDTMIKIYIFLDIYDSNNNNNSAERSINIFYNFSKSWSKG